METNSFCKASPQPNIAGSCPAGSFPALLGSRLVPSPGLSGSRDPPWCTLRTWWREVEWGWRMETWWTCPPVTLWTESTVYGLAARRWNWFVLLKTRRKENSDFLFFINIIRQLSVKKTYPSCHGSSWGPFYTLLSVTAARQHRYWYHPSWRWTSGRWAFSPDPQEAEGTRWPRRASDWCWKICRMVVE